MKTGAFAAPTTAAAMRVAATPTAAAPPAASSGAAGRHRAGSGGDLTLVAHGARRLRLQCASLLAPAASPGSAALPAAAMPARRPPAAARHCSSSAASIHSSASAGRRPWAAKPRHAQLSDAGAVARTDGALQVRKRLLDALVGRRVRRPARQCAMPVGATCGKSCCPSTIVLP